MLGAIMGDVVGSTREHRNVKHENFALLPLGSRFTDDTVMTLAVAKWLMDDALHQSSSLVSIMQEMGRKYPDAGYGGFFRKWLSSDNPQPYNSFGNGSAMRVSPVGLYASTLDEALRLAEITASVTHNHPEGIKGAQAIAACVFLYKHGYTRDYIKQYVEQTFGYDLSIRLEDIRDSYGFDVTCQGSVPIAIMAFLQRDSALGAMRLAISMGGDSDTIGCMTTSIACAQRNYSVSDIGDIPSVVVDRCYEVLTPELIEINDRFEAFFCLGQSDSLKDRIRGSLMAGAAGDALGYAVEFKSLYSIHSKYGYRGITQFELNDDGKAIISDDTQMTLFTANGLLSGITAGCTNYGQHITFPHILGGYIDWYYTQITNNKHRELLDYDFPSHTWLRNLPAMWHRRAPGTTCLTACDAITSHLIVDNNSKGCGGIMRVAPIGLLAAAYKIRNGRKYPDSKIVKNGAYSASITHKHPLGYLPAALMALFIERVTLLSQKEVKDSITDIVKECLDITLNDNDNQYVEEKEYLRRLTMEAIRLAQCDMSDTDAIRQLGEGWTGEEAWAISLYCVMKHFDSVSDAIIAAVNHDGDSDSTGAITGNIMGAIYGYEVVKSQNIFCPEGKELEQTLELSDIILALADDLYCGCCISGHSPLNTAQQRQWHERYCEMKYSISQSNTAERISNDLGV